MTNEPLPITFDKIKELDKWDKLTALKKHKEFLKQCRKADKLRIKAEMQRIRRLKKSDNFIMDG